MKKTILTRLNIVLSALITVLAGIGMTSCDLFAVEYGVEPVRVDTVPQMIVLYGVRAPLMTNDAPAAQSDSQVEQPQQTDNQ